MMGTPRQARGAVAAIFFLNGLVFGEWAARIPAIRDRVGLSDGELGIVLACAAIGSILAMPVAGARAARIGSRRATRVAFALMCLASGVIALAPTLPVLCALAFFYGASMGSLDVTMNAHGVAVERRYGRAILASFHASFSIGGLAGGAIGVFAAAIDLDVRAQLAIVAVISAAVGLHVVAALPGRRRGRHGPRRAALRAPAAAAAGARRAGLRVPADRGRVGRLERRLPARRARHHGGGGRHRLHRLQRHDDRRPHLRRPPGRPLRPRGDRARRRQRRGRSASASRSWRRRRWRRSPASPAWGPGCRAWCRSSSAPPGTCRGWPPAWGWPRCRAPATSASSSARRPSAGSPSSPACRRRCACSSSSPRRSRCWRPPRASRARTTRVAGEAQPVPA